MPEVVSFENPKSFAGKTFDTKTTIIICGVVLLVSALAGVLSYKFIRGTN